jgi:hypothetical protein
MRSKNTLFALAAASAFALPAAYANDMSHQTGPVRDDAVGAGHAYYEPGIRIDELGGPVKPTDFHAPVLSENTAEFGTGDEAATAVENDPRTISWYYPDGTVVHQRDGAFIAESGGDPLSSPSIEPLSEASSLESDALVAESGGPSSGSYMDPLSDASSLESDPLVSTSEPLAGWMMAEADLPDYIVIIE